MTRLWRAAPPTVAGHADETPAGLCATDPDMWLDRAQRATAIHLCLRHCPALDHCATHVPVHPPPHGVIAGVAYVGGARAAGQRAVGTCRLCRDRP